MWFWVFKFITIRTFTNPTFDLNLLQLFKEHHNSYLSVFYIKKISALFIKLIFCVVRQNVIKFVRESSIGQLGHHVDIPGTIIMQIGIFYKMFL